MSDVSVLLNGRPATASELAVPALANKTGVDVEMLQRMLSRQSLSSVRQRFLARLLDDRAAVQEDDSAAGDVELF